MLLSPSPIEILPDRLRRYHDRIESQIQTTLTERFARSRLQEAVCYTPMTGGKRLRPMLVCLAADAVGGRGEDVLPAACGVELLHDASLVLDDLPCMDNAGFRRWKKAAHVVFGEADSLLSAVSLISFAFELFGQNARERDCTAEQTSRIIARVSQAVCEAIEGQSQDLALRREEADLATVERCYRLKTGSVLAVALSLGSRLVGASEQQVSTLEQFGYDAGVAFQLVDDLFDRSNSAEASGKTVGQTRDYLLGLDAAASRARAKELFGRAMSRLESLGPSANALTGVARWAIETRMKKILAAESAEGAKVVEA